MSGQFWSLVTQVRTRTARIRAELVRRTRWPAPVITRVDCAPVPPAGDVVFLRRPAAVRLLLLIMMLFFCQPHAENPPIHRQDSWLSYLQSLALDPAFGIHSHKTLDTAQPCRLLKPN